MSVLATPTTTWQWPADVLAFAAKHQVDGYLDPVLAATRRVFPTATNLRVFLELDPEIGDDWHIIFEVEVPQADIPNYVVAQHRWTDELNRVCPTQLDCMIILTLIPVAR